MNKSTLNTDKCRIFMKNTCSEGDNTGNISGVEYSLCVFDIRMLHDRTNLRISEFQSTALVIPDRE